MRYLYGERRYKRDVLKEMAGRISSSIPERVAIPLFSVDFPSIRSIQIQLVGYVYPFSICCEKYGCIILLGSRDQISTMET